MTFDTGDNPARGLHVLRRALSELIKGFPGAYVVRDWTDRTGCFAKVVRLRGYSDVVLVARATRPFKGCISSQRELVTWAAARSIKIVLVYMAGDFPYFYAFDPDEILAQAKETNPRLDSEMVNYPVQLGKRWDFSEGGPNRLFAKEVLAHA